MEHICGIGCVGLRLQSLYGNQHNQRVFIHKEKEVRDHKNPARVTQSHGEVNRDQKLGDRVIFIVIKKEKQGEQDVLPESTSTMHFISYIQIHADKGSLSHDTNILPK